jgi:hypothetical protein
MRKPLKRILLKTWPKIIVALVGVLIYLSAIRLSGDIEGLLVNIAASLISIPIIFIAYDLWNEKIHRALNENVYRYAENEISQVMLEIRRYMEMFLKGFCVYFDDDDIVLEESDPNNFILKMKDTSKILYDEDKDPYQLKYQLEDYDEDEDDRFDIYGLEKDTVVPVIEEVQYLGYQVVDIDLEDIVESLNELLKNSFIMERMDDEEVSVIIHLLEAFKMLQTFVEGHRDDLFLRTDLKVKGFVCKVSEPKESPIGTVKLYSLYYREEADVKEQARVKQTKKSMQTKSKESTREPSYEQLLDEKILPNVKENVKENELLSVYVVNPDYYIIFGDLITEIIECIRDWRKTRAGAVVTDYESGRIGYL